MCSSPLSVKEKGDWSKNVTANMSLIVSRAFNIAGVKRHFCLKGPSGVSPGRVDGPRNCWILISKHALIERQGHSSVTLSRCLSQYPWLTARSLSPTYQGSCRMATENTATKAQHTPPALSTNRLNVIDSADVVWTQRVVYTNQNTVTKKTLACLYP